MGWNLPRDFFKHRLESEKTIVVLDGLDEAPDITARQQISAIVLASITAWSACKFIVTTRPLAYKGTIVMEIFDKDKALAIPLNLRVSGCVRFKF